MTQEEKAKAYDEAIKVLHKYDGVNIMFSQDLKEEMFPKLREASDKALQYLKENHSPSEVSDFQAAMNIAVAKAYDKGYNDGLKNQGEQKPVTDFLDIRTWKYIVDAVWTEKEGIGQYLDSPFTEEVAKKLQKRFGNIEQKPTDKVEPKFRVGDKIRRKTPRRYDKDMQVARIESDYYLCNHLGKFSSETISFSEESNYELVEHKPAEWSKPKFKIGDWVVYCGDTYQITGLNNNTFTLTGCDGSYFFNLVESTHEPAFHLWTIQDAKAGDVLACPNDAGDRDVVFLFKNINSDEGWVFCFCASDANGCFCTNNDYVGNSNSTNISPATKEQRDLLFQKMKEAGYEWGAKKKELKKIKQNPAWSEEDEFELENVLCHLRNYLHKDSYIRYENWLKSLKDRVQPNPKWRPSDEQMVALDGICSYIRNKADWEISQDMVSDLYKLSEQLKKLKD